MLLLATSSASVLSDAVLTLHPCPPHPPCPQIVSNPTRPNLTWSLVANAGVGDDIVSALGGGEQGMALVPCLPPAPACKGQPLLCSPLYTLFPSRASHPFPSPNASRPSPFPSPPSPARS